VTRMDAEKLVKITKGRKKGIKKDRKKERNAISVGKRCPHCLKRKSRDLITDKLD
jgi:hypothetical protein